MDNTNEVIESLENTSCYSGTGDLEKTIFVQVLIHSRV